MRVAGTTLLLLITLAGSVGCQTTDALLKAGRIDHHANVEGAGGVHVDAWVIAARDAGGTRLDGEHPTAVVLHPWLTDKKWFLPVGETLARTGWNVVLPDLRGHGQSEGFVTTWGGLEREDVKAVVDHCVEQGWIGTEIYAFGASLGGCTAILYAADDERCRGVVAVAPVDGLRGFIDQSSPLTDEDARARKAAKHAEDNGYSPEDASPSATARTMRIPLRLIWGLLDTTVPHEQTARIFDAWAGPKAHEPRLGNHGSIQLDQEDYFVEQLHKVRQMAQEADGTPDREDRGS